MCMTMWLAIAKLFQRIILGINRQILAYAFLVSIAQTISLVFAKWYSVCFSVLPLWYEVVSNRNITQPRMYMPRNTSNICSGKTCSRNCRSWFYRKTFAFHGTSLITFISKNFWISESKICAVTIHNYDFAVSKVS